jgi:fatty-acyl-CoA synthase
MLNHPLSIVSGDIYPPLENQCVNDILAQAVKNYPDSPAVISVWQQRTLNFKELDGLAKQLAASLLESGVLPRDRVGIWSANRFEWVLVQFAVAKIGAILVNINPAYQLNELAHVVEHSGCKAIFINHFYRDKNCLDIAKQVKEKSQCLKSIFIFNEEPIEGAISWRQLFDRSNGASLDEVGRYTSAITSDQLISIQYTSGTTGNPKGATLNHYNMVNNAIQIIARLKLSAADRICVPVPLFHCFGMVLGILGAFSVGAAVVFPTEIFDPESCMAAIDSQSCTTVYGVPMMFIAMLNHPKFDTFSLKSLRSGIMGGAPCPAEVLRAVMDKMNANEMSVAYGMTETSPISFQTRLDHRFDQRVETVGSVLPHTQAKIIDPHTGEILSLGTAGELCIKGYLVMPGYWNNPEATAKVVDGEGWMHTGDLAIMRTDGCLSIVGRIKEMVIRAGENIFPREIEEFLHTIPQIAEAQVFGIPDELYGEQLYAWVRVKNNVTITSEQLKELCKGNLASFKIPKVFRIVNEFPTTASGKVQKFRMRAIEMERAV